MSSSAPQEIPFKSPDGYSKKLSGSKLDQIVESNYQD